MAINRTPLIFAIKHLHVEWNDDHVGSSTDFCLSARLMQNDREIPAANDAKVNEILDQSCNGSLPQEMEMKMLEMACPGWPKEIMIAFHGLTTFGASDLENAKACVQHVLQSDPKCKLARQLVSLLLAQTDVRCPFGNDVDGAPDVPAIIAAEVQP